MHAPTLLALFVVACGAFAAACSSAPSSSGSSGDDAGPGGGGDASAGGGDAASPADDAGSGADAASDAAHEACVFTVDDAGVTHGCGQGGHGPGDKDDGGGLEAAPPPDASADASDLPFGSLCLSNAQCASDLCYDYVVKGQFCTLFCDASAQCPPPSLGCNGMGVCRMGN
jgi:hypothetical protein